MSPKKIAFICAKGLDNFIDSIIENLSDNYFVRKFVVRTQQEIYDAIDWADAVWFEWANEVAIIGTNYDGILQKDVIVRLHSYEIFTNFPGQIRWSTVNRLIFVAPHIREILKESISNLEEKVKTEIVYNGINLDEIPFKEREPGFNIAWVGYINSKKNPQMALQIINKLVKIDKRYKLHIAGSFQELRYKIYLEYMINEMNLQDNVIFHGWVTDLDAFWEDKNYLLHTSIHEGHSYAIMEAMARGIKPVIHNFRGAKELYPGDWLYNIPSEAIERILFNGEFPYGIGEYDSKEYRQWVIDQGWTLGEQKRKIKQIVKRVL